jgi:hypothetical protein
MRKVLLTVGLLVAGVVAFAKWSGPGGDDARDDDPTLVLDRIWVDRVPSKPEETMNLFAALTQQPVGVFQFASQWRGGYEIFQYKAAGKELRVVYPHTGEKEKVKARAWTCKQRDMDYCLELTGASRGVKRYYSQRGWEIDGVTRPEQLLERSAAFVHPAR